MKNDTAPDDRAARWRDYCVRTGLKHTPSREAVVEVFVKGGGDHISLDELLAKARKRHPGLGLATVHRTMKLLEDAGIAERREFHGGGMARYEAVEAGEHHDHMICTACDLVIEFESPEIERIQDEVARKHGFLVQKHRHELYGLCKQCKKEADG